MAVSALVIASLAVAGAWLSGQWLGATASRFAWTATLCIAAIALWFYGYELTALCLRVLPWDDLVFFDRVPLYVAILLLLSVCHERLERLATRRLVLVVAALFGAYALSEAAAPVWLPMFADELSEEAAGPPEVLQSTGWSCGAAALAWTARLQAVPASERQMAELAVTAPLRGTSLRGMVRALHRVGLPASAYRRATWEELLAAPKPAIAGWQLGPTVGHSVVVLAIAGEQITVGDPLAGQLTYSRDEFLASWDRELIALR
ncbi:MAG: cysteine peptidase family C39 domain-containing protein [Armatimonadota bacterium]